MPQVLKEEVFDRIFQAGIDVFYEKENYIVYCIYF